MYRKTPYVRPYGVIYETDIYIIELFSGGSMPGSPMKPALR